MATLGHVAVGMVAARLYRRRGTPRLALAAAMAIWTLLSLAPDLDVIGLRFGIPYAAPWGHRGASHSLLFAVLVGLGCALIAPLLRVPTIRTALFVAGVVGSHGVLDAFTDGGLGIAFLWPFDLTRYFAPWTPIPVAPIGSAFLSARGLAVAAAELFLFSPLLIAAFWPRADTRRDEG